LHLLFGFYDLFKRLTQGEQSYLTPMINLWLLIRRSILIPSEFTQRCKTKQST
jgi:hypothetical protein